MFDWRVKAEDRERELLNLISDFYYGFFELFVADCNLFLNDYHQSVSMVSYRKSSKCPVFIYFI